MLKLRGKCAFACCHDDNNKVPLVVGMCRREKHEEQRTLSLFGKRLLFESMKIIQ